MNAYEVAKSKVALAEKLAQAVADGKKIWFRGRFGWKANANTTASEFFDDMHQFEYRIQKSQPTED